MSQLAEGLTAVPGCVLGLAIAPVAREGLAFQDRPDGMDSWPVRGMLDQILPDPVGEGITESTHLGRLLVADDDRRVALGPKPLEPLVKAAHLVPDLRRWAYDHQVNLPTT
jgi:hypothetical protein